jgi:hypothetical protein
MHEPDHLQLHQSASPLSVYTQLEVEDECIMLEVRLHITIEVVSQLDKAEESKWLSPEELSLHNILVEQIRYMQMVVKAQDDAPS